MDMSPFMTNIQIPVNGDSITQGFTVIYITKSLFDCDSTTIEYVFERQYDLTHAFRVYRTDGTLLLQVDSANGPYGFGTYGGSHEVRPILNTSDGAKLFLQKVDNNNVGKVLVYALCGTLPAIVYDFSVLNSFVRVYPNPSSSELNFEVNLPNNQEEFKIIITDANVKEIRKNQISLTYGKCSVNINDYSSGCYFYSLVGNNRVYQTGKFIINK